MTWGRISGCLVVNGGIREAIGTGGICNVVVIGDPFAPDDPRLTWVVRVDARHWQVNEDYVILTFL